MSAYISYQAGLTGVLPYRSIGDASVPLWTALMMGFTIMTPSTTSLRSIHDALASRSISLASVMASEETSPDTSKCVINTKAKQYYSINE